MTFYRITRKKDVRLRKQLNKLKRSLSYRKGVKALRKANPGNAAPIVTSFTARLQRETLIKRLAKQMGTSKMRLVNKSQLMQSVAFRGHCSDVDSAKFRDYQQPLVEQLQTDSPAAARFRQGEDAVRHDFWDATTIKVYEPGDHQRLTTTLQQTTKLLESGMTIQQIEQAISERKVGLEEALDTLLAQRTQRPLQALIDSPEFKAVIQKPMILPISVADYQKDTDEK